MPEQRCSFGCWSSCSWPTCCSAGGAHLGCRALLAAGVCVVALLATWGYAGHGRSMRWPWLGVPLDMVHPREQRRQWLGGLVLHGGSGGPAGHRRGTHYYAARRFSRVAGVAVMVVIVTGTLQAVRLVGAVRVGWPTRHTADCWHSSSSPSGRCCMSPTSTGGGSTVDSTSVTTATRGAEIALRRAMTTEAVPRPGNPNGDGCPRGQPAGHQSSIVCRGRGDRSARSSRSTAKLTSGSGTIRVKVDEAEAGEHRTTLHVTPIEPRGRHGARARRGPVRGPDRSTALDLRPARVATFSAELPLTSGRGLAPPDRRGREPGGPVRGDDGGGGPERLLLSVVRRPRGGPSVSIRSHLRSPLVSWRCQLAALTTPKPPTSPQTVPSTPTSPGTATADASANDADVSFVQGMIPHHEQAVEMAQGLRPGSTELGRPPVKDLATRISQAQDPGIQQMRGWLAHLVARFFFSSGDMAGHDMAGMMTVDDMEGLERVGRPPLRPTLDDDDDRAPRGSDQHVPEGQGPGLEHQASTTLRRTRSSPHSRAEIEEIRGLLG